jgi:hypothetical protein
MRPIARIICLAVPGVGGVCAEARAQTAPDGNWSVTVYPIFAWLPVDVGLGIDVSGGDDGGSVSGEILDSRFDGAYFGGVAASNGPWRIEGYGIWAAFGGSRPDLPFLEVDLDVVYGDVRLGRRVARDFYVTAGVRRVALEYDIALGTLPRLSRKPGVWDPIVGIGWHRVRPKFDGMPRSTAGASASARTSTSAPASMSTGSRCRTSVSLPATTCST